jgi:hypothetical protein
LENYKESYAISEATNTARGELISTIEKNHAQAQKDMEGRHVLTGGCIFVAKLMQFEGWKHAYELLVTERDGLVAKYEEVVRTGSNRGIFSIFVNDGYGNGI